MKKTLLTIALAALATSAFAGNVYKYDSATSAATLNLDTTIKYRSHFTKNSRLDLDKQVIYNKEGKAVYLKSKEKESHFRPEVKFAVSAKGLDKETGFFISTFGEVKSKADYYVKPDSKKVDNLSLNKAYIGFGSDAYGSFQVGKLDTVADYKFGSFSNTDVLTTSVHDAETKFDFAVNYLSPVYSGVKVGASFGRTKSAEKSFEIQYAGLVSYENFGADFTLVGYKNTTKTNKLKQVSQTGVELSASYKLGSTALALSTGYATAHQSKAVLTGKVAADDSKLDSGFQKHSGFDVAFEVSNDCIAFAQPYLGVYYVQSKNLPQDRLSYTKEKSLTTLAGVNSDLFTVASLKTSAYAEVGYNLTSNYTKVKETSKLSDKEVTKGYNLGFGVKVTF